MARSKRPYRQWPMADPSPESSSGHARRSAHSRRTRACDIAKDSAADIEPATCLPLRSAAGSHCRPTNKTGPRRWALSKIAGKSGLLRQTMGENECGWSIHLPYQIHFRASTRAALMHLFFWRIIALVTSGVIEDWRGPNFSSAQLSLAYI